MENPKRIVQLLTTFLAIIACVVVVNTRSGLQTSMGSFLAWVRFNPTVKSSSSSRLSAAVHSVASIAPVTLKGDCLVVDFTAVPPPYTENDNGYKYGNTYKGYTKTPVGSAFPSLEDVQAACTVEKFRTLESQFCAANPQSSYLKDVRAFSQSNELAEEKYDTRRFSCSTRSSATMPSSARVSSSRNVISSAGLRTISSSSSSSASASSVWSEEMKGVCVVRYFSTGIPSPTAADTGKGYSKVDIAPVTLATYTAACTSDLFDSLIKSYCASNPGVTYKKEAAAFNAYNVLIMNSCQPYGCQNIRCPGTVSSSSSAACSSSSASTVSTEAAAMNGVCVVRAFDTKFPAFTNPDAGTGYAKMLKGTNFTSLSALRSACTQDDYDVLEEEYCERNPDESYEMHVVLYDKNGNFKSESCGSEGCDLVQCPPPDDVYDEGTWEYED